MFQPNVAIIRFSSESMVVVLYRFGMGMSGWWDLSICDVCYMLFLRGTVWGGICDVRYPGVCSSSMSAHCCSMWVSCYCLSISDVLVVCFCYGLCVYPLYLWWSLCPVCFVCAFTCLPSRGCCIWRFGDRVPDLFGDCHLALWYFTDLLIPTPIVYIHTTGMAHFRMLMCFSSQICHSSGTYLFTQCLILIAVRCMQLSFGWRLWSVARWKSKYLAFKLHLYCACARGFR